MMEREETRSEKWGGMDGKERREQEGRGKGRTGDEVKIKERRIK